MNIEMIYRRMTQKYNQKVSDYGQEIPQSHTADQPAAPWDRVTEHQQSQAWIMKTIKPKQPAPHPSSAR